RAIELEPTFAAAHLRWMLIYGYVDASAREHFRKTETHRSSLTPHDRALLDALEPRIRAPADFGESERRLAQTLSREPLDVDYTFQLARLKFYGNDCPGVVELGTQVLRLDP